MLNKETNITVRRIILNKLWFDVRPHDVRPQIFSHKTKSIWMLPNATLRMCKRSPSASPVANYRLYKWMSPHYCHYRCLHSILCAEAHAHRVRIDWSATIPPISSLGLRRPPLLVLTQRNKFALNTTLFRVNLFQLCFVCLVFALRACQMHAPTLALRSNAQSNKREWVRARRKEEKRRDRNEENYICRQRAIYTHRIRMNDQFLDVHNRFATILISDRISLHTVNGQKGESERDSVSLRPNWCARSDQ